MKKFNWEYDFPKLKNFFMIITVIVWVLVQMFHWVKVEFVSEIMIGLVCVSTSISDWLEKKRGSAVFWAILAICWLGLAVRSLLKYNI